MKNLGIIIPAGVCAIIGIVAVVMLTKGSGEKVLSKSFVGKTGNTTQTVGKTGNTTQTFDENIRRAIEEDKLYELSPRAQKVYKEGLALGVYEKPVGSFRPPPPTPVTSNTDAKTGQVTNIHALTDIRSWIATNPNAGLQLYKQDHPDHVRGIPRRPDYYVLPKKSRKKVRWEHDPTTGGVVSTEEEGYKGWLNMTDGSGRKVADYSWKSDLRMNGYRMSFPLIIPSSTQEEINWLLSGKEPTYDIIRKARFFAEGRLSKGMSPFKKGAGAGGLTPIQSYMYLSGDKTE
jgi:hypothetical protein